MLTFRDKDSSETRRLIKRLRRVRPRTRRELAAYVEGFLGIRIPSRKICPDHDSPMDYLAWSFLNEGKDADRDCVVWANRGGGKTQLGAVASLLECIFLPGCKVRILGGSEEQSLRMYEYLRASIEGGFSDFVAGRVKVDLCRFKNKANVQVLTQSDRSVRGHHVQRLRCDEVELFDRNIWQAAQFVTNSTEGIPARLEALSTLHRPFGLMNDIVTSAGQNAMKVFRWCLWEVIEKCEGRSCSQCRLLEDCRGLAKKADGYYSIDDAIAQKKRSSKEAWQAEILCRRPNREDLVFSEFDPARHVQTISYNSNLPLYRSIDFGFSNPLACLLIQVDAATERVYVLAEHIKSRTTLAEHARLIKQRWPWPIEATYCDPAGRGHNEITGTSIVGEMAALGIPVRSRSSRILEGIEMIRRVLAPALGQNRLFISPDCEQLIRAFQSLHYSRLPNGALSELPHKDGVHDHVIDALRYFFVNRFGRPYSLREKRY